jgi:hypothetical protein
VPCLLSLRASQRLASSLWRSSRHVASEKAPLRWALPILLPPVPCFFPADSWLHRPGVGQGPADRGEAAAVVDLVQQDQRQHRPDAGDGARPGVGLRVVHLGGPGQVQLGGADLPVAGVDEGQVEFDVLLDGGVGEACGQVQLGAVGGVGELLGERRQVVLAVGVGQVDEGLGTLADQGSPSSEEVAVARMPSG